MPISMTNCKAYIAAIILFGILSVAGVPVVRAQSFPQPYTPPRLVNDFTGLLPVDQQIVLNNKLLEFQNQTSTQIFVVTYDSLQGYDAADYAVRLTQMPGWEIGQEGKNNGILIFISPALRKMTIQTGYGLEGAVPDAICSRLIRNVLEPHFKNGEYYAGLDSATNVLMSLTRGEYTADKYMKKGEQGLPKFFFLLFFGILILALLSGRRKRVYSPGHSLPWWLLLGAGSSGSSGWGSFSSGSGSFGGGSGGFGGFGGAGGGSFGGGGASGGW
jgi:uncharacterized protein